MSTQACGGEEAAKKGKGGEQTLAERSHDKGELKVMEKQKRRKESAKTLDDKHVRNVTTTVTNEKENDGQR